MALEKWTASNRSFDADDLASLLCHFRPQHLTRAKMTNTQSEYLPAPAVQARYAISDMTLWRWLRNPELSFPRPIVINRRRLFSRAELETWERGRVRTGTRVAA